MGTGPLTPGQLSPSAGPSGHVQVVALKALSKHGPAVCPVAAGDVPQRIRYRYCRTPVQPPAGFDVALIANSAQPPAEHLSLEHIYGYCRNETISGPNLFALPGGREVVYTSAAVGVIHDIGRNRQRFLQGHTDDISALTVHPEGKMAATGASG